MTRSYTHTGFRRETGYVHGAALYGHADYSGVAHALNGPEHPHSGAAYAALCGKTVRAEHNGGSFNLSPATDQAGNGVTCKRCLEIMRSRGKRCKHSWRPMLVVPALTSMPEEKRLAIAFGVGLSHAQGYDVCEHCGRISYLRKWRGQRSLVSCPHSEESIRKRVAETQAWIDRELGPTTGG